MILNVSRTRHYLHNAELQKLFVEELGWDRHAATLPVAVDGQTYTLRAFAEKRGVLILECPPDGAGQIPIYDVRRKIEKQVTKSAYEHLIIFGDAEKTTQVWQWVARQPGQPAAYREHSYSPRTQAGDALLQKLGTITIPFSESEAIDLTGAVHLLRDAFDRDRVTRRFYDHFKQQHAAFLAFIKGITDQADKEWYASLMLNRLMFVYFIQKKGFLDGDPGYLRDRLVRVQQRKGTGKFQTFYRYFLLCLFHEGLSRQPPQRTLTKDLDELLGNVPYLNGGLFDAHDLEIRHDKIDIPDEAFERLFDFFDQYDWHLDARPLRNDREINPDVLGYIFEKYINQKQMGAYYTKEDITDYISKNTIIPHLFDVARQNCAIAFDAGSPVWRQLADNPDRYLYPSVRHGVLDDQGEVIPLPPAIQRGVEDAGQRDGWNRPAATEYALPTETWREHVARRQRCLTLREKLLDGQVSQINDLVTFNLDIRQFAEDTIVSCEGPELLRAFYQATSTITILDPTCGSGAFLFAALNVLQPLYEACLDRMQAFVDDLDRSGEAHSPKKFEDFRHILADVARHPNRDYFILKSIIVNNLYGVDIMEEAVEICKLRLFLKLVAQVDARPVQDNFGLEPLPDIDFNIRPGNTLVGFATKEDVRRAFEGKMDFENEVDTILQDAQKAEEAFAVFQRLQTEYGTNALDYSEVKQGLRKRLQALRDQLDRTLAGIYGVDPEKPRKYAAWVNSHQPFHWFAEFYGIMSRGGFDVVIGNPPYIELKEISQYNIRGFRCVSAGNVYAVAIERCFALCPETAKLGFIVPVSSVSTDRYLPLQNLLSTRNLHYSAYDDRPSRLFDGLEHIRLTIHILGDCVAKPTLYSTRYMKWSAQERPALFHLLRYEPSHSAFVPGSLPKLSDNAERSIFRKLALQKSDLKAFYARNGTHGIFYSRKVGYFLQVLDFQPSVRDGRGQLRPPSEFKTLSFSTEDAAKLALCCLNANLFYWFVTVFSDCRHINKREVDALPVDLSKMAAAKEKTELLRLSRKLMKDIQDNSEERRMSFHHDALTVQCIIPKRSKAIIDQIDKVLGRYLGLTDGEVDFLVNYDIKYRMGQEEAEDDE